MGACVISIDNLRSLARLAAAGFAFTFLAACFSTANQQGASTFSPAPPSAGNGSVYIGRPFGPNTSIFSLPIHLDGKPLASLGPNQYVMVELPPGQHSVGVPDEAWNRAIAGKPHPVEFKVEAGKTYYLLPSRRYEDGGQQFAFVGNAVVSHRVAVTHSSFSVQVVAANAAPPPEFGSLTPVQPQ